MPYVFSNFASQLPYKFLKAAWVAFKSLQSCLKICLQIFLQRARCQQVVMFRAPEHASTDIPGSGTCKYYVLVSRKCKYWCSGLQNIQALPSLSPQRVKSPASIDVPGSGAWRFPYILPAKAPAWWRSLEVQIIQKHICVSECFQGIKGH